MKHIITYTTRHKEVIEYAISMALAWHEGNIEPVCDLMLKAFKRHNPEVENVDEALKQIRADVKAIRDIDVNGEAFGKHDVLAAITLADSGETMITEQEAAALEHLSESVARLIAGQVEVCFDWFNIPHIDRLKHRELDGLTAVLHSLCWNMPRHANYGICYSEESDILWDIYQVLRHERYLNFSDEQKEAARWTVLADKPMQTAKESLIRIKTIIENDE